MKLGVEWLEDAGEMVCMSTDANVE
jgi:hypothetical protein